MVELSGVGQSREGKGEDRVKRKVWYSGSKGSRAG